MFKSISRLMADFDNGIMSEATLVYHLAMIEAKNIRLARKCEIASL